MDKEISNLQQSSKLFRMDVYLLEDRMMDVEMSALGAHCIIGEVKEEARDLSDLCRCQGLRPFTSFPLVVRAFSGPPFLPDIYHACSDLYSRPRLPRSPRTPQSSPFYLLV